nr:ATP-binding protein [uncultured Muribaculum sp.]
MEENKDIKIIRKAATELKLPLWRDALDEYIGRFVAQSWSVQHLMAVMMQDQLKMRADNRRRTLIKRADFPQLKYLGDLIVDELPDDARTALPLLRSLDFIRQGRNPVLYGNPGTGKTHIATALGIEACTQGMTVMFTSVPRLITQIRRQSPRDCNGRPADTQSLAHKHDRRIIQNERNVENTPKSTIIISNFLICMSYDPAHFSIKFYTIDVPIRIRPQIGTVPSALVSFFFR